MMSLGFLLVNFSLHPQSRLAVVEVQRNEVADAMEHDKASCQPALTLFFEMERNIRRNAY